MRHLVVVRFFNAIGRTTHRFEQAFYALTGERETLVDMRGDIYSWAIMVYEVVTGTHPFVWAIRGIKDPLVSQRTLLKAIAANDRRGFQTTGDITFDSLIYNCTCDLKHRVADIALANKVLRQFTQRIKLQQSQDGGGDKA